MHRLRTRLIAAFLAATLLPLAATIWIAKSLLDRSLGYSTTAELTTLSRTLEATVRQFYQRERDALKQDALSGRAPTTTYDAGNRARWPDNVLAFWDSGESERFGLSGAAGDHLDYQRRLGTTDAPRVEVSTRDLGGIRMDQLTQQLHQARDLVSSIDDHDLRRGFTLTLLVLLGVTWLLSLVPLVFIAHRVSQPIQQLTAALTDFAAGDWSRRLDGPTPGPPHVEARDEVGRAVAAFNRMADQLRQSRERLVQLTQMASWQSLARKTAHELKNSLTPIRLTVEEMQARLRPDDRTFLDQAVQIVVSEIDSLERRVRAFSEFASEPAVVPETLDVNALVAERVALLRPAHPETDYDVALDSRGPRVCAGADLVKGILTNLLKNAAEAAGPGGRVLAVTKTDGDHVAIEVHDSGPGVTPEASATLFEPTITFKPNGMGLGLSIAKRHALLSGGDVALITSALGGAAFRVTLPAFDGPTPERLQ